MWSTDCIDIVLFHQFQIIDDLLICHGTAIFQAGIVTVDTAEDNLLSCDLHLFLFCIVDVYFIDLAETDMFCFCFDHFSGAVF